MNRMTVILLAALLLLPLAHAELKLDNIQFDPAVIASGDRVDIVAQFHETGTFAAEDRVGNPAYTFKVMLEPDDSLTRQYVLMENAEGNDLQGIITKGAYYNKRFRIKVADNAPAGEYSFRLVGQWYRDGQPMDAASYLRFTMPVKREGIALSVANVVSSPERIRSGDKDVLLTTTITNTGEKTAKNVRIRLVYPEGISSSYSNNNEITLGSIEPQAQKDVKFYIDTDRFIPEGVYGIAYSLTYQDLENNAFGSNASFPLVVKKRPNIVVLSSEGKGLAGNDVELRVKLQNKGEETADAVDVRILKQSSQPFEMDVRSDYVGRMAPNETATAVFRIHAVDGAEIKEHKLTALIRAKGDSEEGDDNMYTAPDAVTLEIAGKRRNNYPLYAGIFLGAVIIIAVAAAVMRRSGRVSKRTT